MSNAINSGRHDMRWVLENFVMNNVGQGDDEASTETSGSSSKSGTSARPSLIAKFLYGHTFSSGNSDTSYQGDLGTVDSNRRHTRSQGSAGLVGPLEFGRRAVENLTVVFQTKQQPSQEISTQTEHKVLVESSTQTKKESGSMKILLSVAALIGTLVLAGAYFYSSQANMYNAQLDALNNNHTDQMRLAEVACNGKLEGFAQGRESLITNVVDGTWKEALTFLQNNLNCTIVRGAAKGIEIDLNGQASAKVQALRRESNIRN